VFEGNCIQLGGIVYYEESLFEKLWGVYTILQKLAEEQKPSSPTSSVQKVKTRLQRERESPNIRFLKY